MTSFSEMLFNQGCQMNRIAEKAYGESSKEQPAPEAAGESPKARDEVTVELLGALRELSNMYTSAWDLVDGGLLMMEGSVSRFERAHARARRAIARAEKA